MADNDLISNGLNGNSSELTDSPTKKAGSFESYDNGNGTAGNNHINLKIEALEREKSDLVSENAESSERIRELKAEMGRLAREKAAVESELSELKASEAERSAHEGRVMEEITKRAFELEGEVARLQDYLVTAMNAGDEANREAEELRKEIANLKKERATLSEQVSSQAEELKRLRSDGEGKIEEMEKTVEELKNREGELRREKSEAEERMKVKISEAEKEISELRQAKIDVEDTMVALQVELKMSENKVKEMGEKVVQLAKKSEESEALIAGLMEKAARGGMDEFFASEAAEDRNRELDEGAEKEQTEAALFPLVAAGAVSTGVVVAAGLAVCYMRYSRTN